MRQGNDGLLGLGEVLWAGGGSISEDRNFCMDLAYYAPCHAIGSGRPAKKVDSVCSTKEVNAMEEVWGPEEEVSTRFGGNFVEGLWRANELMLESCAENDGALKEKGFHRSDQ